MAPKAYLERFGRRLRQLREERGLTIADVAEKSGIRELVIAGLEKARFKDFDIETANDIAKAIGVDLLQLFIFPETSARAAVVDRSRYMTDEELEEVVEFMDMIGPEAPAPPPLTPPPPPAPHRRRPARPTPGRRPNPKNPA
jgi:transcriptional regulator with XRE-family HTH domain